jgi:hypothetical protein
MGLRLDCRVDYRKGENPRQDLDYNRRLGGRHIVTQFRITLSDSFRGSMGTRSSPK